MKLQRGTVRESLSENSIDCVEETNRDNSYHTSIPSLSNVWSHRPKWRSRRRHQEVTQHRYPPSLFTSRAEDLWKTLTLLRAHCSCSSSSDGENCSRLSLGVSISDASLGSSESSVPPITATGLTDTLGDTLTNTHMAFEILVACMVRLMNRFNRRSSSSDFESSPTTLKALPPPECVPTPSRKQEIIRERGCVGVLSMIALSGEPVKCPSYRSTGRIGIRKRGQSSTRTDMSGRKKILSSAESPSCTVPNVFKIPTDALSEEKRANIVQSRRALLSEYFHRKIDLPDVNRRLEQSERRVILDATRSESRLNEDKLIQSIHFNRTQERGSTRDVIEQKATKTKPTTMKKSARSSPARQGVSPRTTSKRRVTFSDPVPEKLGSILKTNGTRSDSEEDSSSSSAQSFSTAVTSYSDGSKLKCLFPVRKSKDSESTFSSSKSSRSSKKLSKSESLEDCNAKLSLISADTQYSDPSIFNFHSRNNYDTHVSKKTHRSSRKDSGSVKEKKSWKDGFEHSESDRLVNPLVTTGLSVSQPQVHTKDLTLSKEILSPNITRARKILRQRILDHGTVHAPSSDGTGKSVCRSALRQVRSEKIILSRSTPEEDNLKRGEFNPGHKLVTLNINICENKHVNTNKQCSIGQPEEDSKEQKMFKVHRNSKLPVRLKKSKSILCSFSQTSRDRVFETVPEYISKIPVRAPIIKSAGLRSTTKTVKFNVSNLEDMSKTSESHTKRNRIELKRRDGKGSDEDKSAAGSEDQSSDQISYESDSVSAPDLRETYYPRKVPSGSTQCEAESVRNPSTVGSDRPNVDESRFKSVPKISHRKVTSRWVQAADNPESSHRDKGVSPSHPSTSHPRMNRIADTRQTEQTDFKHTSQSAPKLNHVPPESGPTYSRAVGDSFIRAVGLGSATTVPSRKRFWCRENKSDRQTSVRSNMNGNRTGKTSGPESGPETDYETESDLESDVGSGLSDIDTFGKLSHTNKALLVVHAKSNGSTSRKLVVQRKSMGSNACSGNSRVGNSTGCQYEAGHQKSGSESETSETDCSSHFKPRQILESDSDTDSDFGILTKLVPYNSPNGFGRYSKNNGSIFPKKSPRHVIVDEDNNRISMKTSEYVRRESLFNRNHLVASSRHCTASSASASSVRSTRSIGTEMPEERSCLSMKDESIDTSGLSTYTSVETPLERSAPIVENSYGSCDTLDARNEGTDSSNNILIGELDLVIGVTSPNLNFPQSNTEIVEDSNETTKTDDKIPQDHTNATMGDVVAIKTDDDSSELELVEIKMKSQGDFESIVIHTPDPSVSPDPPVSMVGVDETENPNPTVFPLDNKNSPSTTTFTVIKAPTESSSEIIRAVSSNPRLVPCCSKTRDCPICSKQGRPSSRYVLPACIVKGARPMPRNEKDPWIRVMERVTVKHNPRRRAPSVEKCIGTFHSQYHFPPSESLSTVMKKMETSVEKQERKKDELKITITEINDGSSTCPTGSAVQSKKSVVLYKGKSKRSTPQSQSTLCPSTSFNFSTLSVPRTRSPRRCRKIQSIANTASMSNRLLYIISESSEGTPSTPPFLTNSKPPAKRSPNSSSCKNTKFDSPTYVKGEPF